MAIAYSRVRFLNILRNGGACKAFAYVSRRPVEDEQLGKTFDFPLAPRDLVFETMLLPDGAPFRTPAELANALDVAERRRQRRSTNRKRWPQFGAELMAALPPDRVVTLDEATELTERLVRYAVGGSTALPVYFAIHDPALIDPSAETRHVHVLFGLREIVGTGLCRTKIRNVFAQPRHAGAPNAHGNYVAEAISWPDVVRDLLTTLLAEIGSDEVVDPPAPVATRHWSVKTLQHSPERRTHHDQSVDRQNTALIYGPAAELVARMLRGRSVMRIDEVRHLLARFLDSSDERDERLDAILTDTETITLATNSKDTQPRWLTIKSVHRVTRMALAAVDRAMEGRGDGNPPPFLDYVAVGNSETDIVHGLVRRLSVSANPIHRLLIIGQRHSDCSALVAELREAEPIVGTFTMLKAAPARNRYGRIGRIGLRSGDLIIVPRAETVPDQDLATLLLRSKRYGTRLLLGYDTSRASISCGLAARVADVLGDSVPLTAEDSVGMLRAGLVDRACRTQDREGRIRFGRADQTTREAADFVVCDDITRLASVDREIHGARPDDVEADAVLAVETAKGPLPLRRGQWIVYTANDYATEHIRVGRFAKVVGASSPHVLEVAHPNDVEANLDLRTFPHVRSAHAISIREARQTPQDTKLLIEVLTRQHAWSATLLAANRADNAVIHIDPSVAKNSEEWIAAVASSKPTPLVTDLVARTDPVAELNVLMRMIYLGSPTTQPRVEKRPPDRLRLEDWMQSMSDLARGTSEEARYVLPHAANTTAAASMTRTASVEQTSPQPNILSAEQRQRLHEDLRAALYSNPDTRKGLERLQSALAPANEQRDVIAEKIRQVCPPEGPMAALLQILLGQPEPMKADEFDELELPIEMAARMPRGWSQWELWKFKMDLRTMAYPHANWQMPLGPAEPVGSFHPYKDVP